MSNAEVHIPENVTVGGAAPTLDAQVIVTAGAGPYVGVTTLKGAAGAYLTADDALRIGQALITAGWAWKGRT